MSRTSDRSSEARDQITQTEEAEARDHAARATTLFDLRRVIGALLLLYGVVLTAMGLFASEATKTKAAGINIDLWAGLAILAAGVLFVAWALLRPLRAEELDDADEDRPRAA
jgi:cation transport ATPase